MMSTWACLGSEMITNLTPDKKTKKSYMHAILNGLMSCILYYYDWSQTFLQKKNTTQL